MIDIIERLRSYAGQSRAHPHIAAVLEDCGRAADEIEALRKDAATAVAAYSKMTATVDQLLAQRDQLRAEVEALRKDAERYRWLRDNPWPPELEADIRLHRNARWDAEIDAAMAVKGKP